MSTDGSDRSSRSDRGALRRLAGALRIFTEYESERTGVVEAGDEALLRVIRSLGQPIESAAQASEILKRIEVEEADRLVEPVTVCWIG